jgi:type IV pilus assembly protein PilN
MARLHLNLASEPFRRDRPMIVASIAVGLLMAAVLAVQIYLVLSEREQMADTRAAIAEYERQLARVNADDAKLQAVLRQPENAEALERTVLLNTLIRRKAISWTKIFADLEKVMPHNVRLISIRPEIAGNNEVALQMIVGAQSHEPVLQMLVNLQGTSMFGPASISNLLPPSQSDPLYRFRVSVTYAQTL